MSQFESVQKQRAAALKYDPEKNGAPVIVASGMGYTAERITEAAMRAGVPVYEDDSLASLLTQLKMGSEIPRELFQAIVEIYVYFLGFGASKDANGNPVKAETAENAENGGVAGENGFASVGTALAEGQILAEQAAAKGNERAMRTGDRPVNPAKSGLSSEEAAVEIAAAAAASVIQKAPAERNEKKEKEPSEVAWKPQRYRADGTKVEDGGR